MLEASAYSCYLLQGCVGALLMKHSYLAPVCLRVSVAIVHGVALRDARTALLRVFHEGKQLHFTTPCIDIVGEVSFVLRVLSTVGVVERFKYIRSSISLVGDDDPACRDTHFVIREGERFRCPIDLQTVRQLDHLRDAVAIASAHEVAGVAHEAHGGEDSNDGDDNDEFNQSEPTLRVILHTYKMKD